MTFRHVVMFRFTEAATDEQRRTLARALDGLPAATGTLEEAGYRHGPDAGVNEGNWDYVVVADFASVDDYLAYRDHPDHRDVIRDLVAPILAERAAVQYQLPG